jgi:DNA-directed RNA polymerase specialized sigma24 family protein
MIDPEALVACIQQAQTSLEDLRRLTEGFVRARLVTKYKLDPGATDVLLDKVYSKVAAALFEYNAGNPKRTFAWFMTIVDHAAIDRLRATRGPMVPLDDAMEIPDEQQPGPPKAHDREQVFSALHTALARVSSAKRKAALFQIAFNRDISSAELARILDLPSIDAARQLKFNALKEIRCILADLGCGPDVVRSLFR